MIQPVMMPHQMLGHPEMMMITPTTFGPPMTGHPINGMNQLPMIDQPMMQFGQPVMEQPIPNQKILE